MKKFLVLLFALLSVVTIVGCKKDPEKKEYTVEFIVDEEVVDTQKVLEGKDAVAPKDPVKDGYKFTGWDKEFTNVTSDLKVNAVFEKLGPSVMTYQEFVNAELDSEVIIEGYVQAAQLYSTSYNNTSLYLQDKDGAYFVYRLACTEEEYAKFVKGVKVRITGTKSAWSGEVEITDATFEVLEGSYIAEAKDVTELLGTDELINSQNQFVSFKGLKVEASKDAEGNDVAFLYKYNGSGEDGDDLYFNVSYKDNTYQFLVESDLCNKDSEVYKAVKSLKIGDVIDLEGFLYWYNGVNPHITKVEVKSHVMTYQEFASAELNSDVVIEGYVQAAQLYSTSYNNTTLYLQDKDGAYFVYRLACTEEEYAKFVKGVKVRITGTKSAWSGEVEITDATFEVLEGSYIAEAKDVTELLGTDELINSQNQFVSFKGLKVEASKDAEGNDVAFLYKYNGSGEDGDDLYFNVSYKDNTYQFLVESDLCNKDSEVYKAVKSLKIGDVIDLEGFLYWYNGVNPHITKVTVK